MARIKTATRTISNPSSGHVIGLLPSKKNLSPVAWESGIERDYCYYCEFWKRVGRYVPQPEQAEIWVDGRLARYTPDTRIYLDDGSASFIEVKPDDWEKNPKLVRRLTAAKSHYQRQGSGFHVVKASDIRRGHLINNIKLLYYYADWRSTTKQKSLLMDCLPENGEAVYLGDVRETARSMKFSLGIVYRCMFEELIGADLESMPISSDMMVWRNSK